MSGISEISFSSLTSVPWLVWPALVLLLGLTVVLYRVTNPPLVWWKRLGMALVRSVALGVLFVMLLELVISYRHDEERRPRVAVLVDHSDSMEQIDGDRSRRSRLDSLLGSESYERLSDATAAEVWYFGGNLTSEENRLVRDKTALGDALTQLSREELGRPADYWLLLSDGNSNSGRSIEQAADGLPTPVFAVDLGGDLGSLDVGITGVDFNPVVFAGQSTELKIGLHWRQAEGKSIVVRLKDGDRVLTENRIPIQQQDGFAETVLKYSPERPGKKMLTVEIPELSEETDDGNNRRTVSLKVLKSRLSVLLVARSADYEVGFLHRFLRQSDKYDVQLVLTGDKAGNLSGIFPAQQSELNRYDLLVLYDPNPHRLSNRKEMLRSYLADRGGAVWVVMGEQYAVASRSDWFDDLLPFHPKGPGSLARGQFHGEPVEGNLFHPTVRLAEDRSGIRAAWADLPPFRSLVRCSQISDQAVVLAQLAVTGPGDRPPILGYRRHGRGKLLASAALPFWTWGFTALGYGLAPQYQPFAEGTISWLTIPEDYDPVKVSPTKDVFSRGETITFEGHAFDLGYRPLAGVTGTVKMTEKTTGEQFEADLIGEGEGKYSAELSGVPPGSYEFVGRFEKDGLPLDEQSGELVVEAYSLEQRDPSGNPGTLRAIARLTGGDYFRWQEFNSVIERLNLGPVAESSRMEAVLWSRQWLLWIILAALSVEWLLRKANHLL